jgi:hypothetical protein
MAKTEPKIVDNPTTEQDIAAALSGNPTILAANASSGAAPLLDGMSVADLRLDQNFVESGGVKKLLTTVPIRKPNPQDFNRVHPDPAFRSVVALIELKEDRDIYLLTPAMAEQMPGEFFAATLSRRSIVKVSSFFGRCGCRQRTVAKSSGIDRRRWRLGKP